jgi:hypothetical protein
VSVLGVLVVGVLLFLLAAGRRRAAIEPAA